MRQSEDKALRLVGLCPGLHLPSPKLLEPLRFGGHEAADYTFVLPHDIPVQQPTTNVVQFHEDINFSDSTPIGGWLDAVVDMFRSSAR